MSEYIDLNSAANRRWHTDSAWCAARVVSAVVMEEIMPLEQDGIAVFEVQDDMSGALGALLRRRDLIGPVTAEFTMVEASWAPGVKMLHGIVPRRYTPHNAQLHGEAVALIVNHDEGQLLGTALPADAHIENAMRYGYACQSISPIYEGNKTLDMHNRGEADKYYPRQVQAAAWIAREIVNGHAQQIPTLSEEAAQTRQAYGRRLDAQYAFDALPAEGQPDGVVVYVPAD